MFPVTYLRDLAQQAGFATEALTVAEIGWDGRQLVDLANKPIGSVYKLYPLEWLLAESFASQLIATYPAMQWIEPPWKLVARRLRLSGEREHSGVRRHVPGGGELVRD